MRLVVNYCSYPLIRRIYRPLKKPFPSSRHLYGVAAASLSLLSTRPLSAVWTRSVGAMPKAGLLMLVFGYRLKLFDSCSRYCYEVFMEDQTLVPIANSDLRHFKSSLLGQEYFVKVRLPEEYSEGSTLYPVLYLLDGDHAFAMATDIVQYLIYGKHIP